MKHHGATPPHIRRATGLRGEELLDLYAISREGVKFSCLQVCFDDEHGEHVKIGANWETIDTIETLWNTVSEIQGPQQLQSMLLNRH